jgi:hypothetical protein
MALLQLPWKLDFVGVREHGKIALRSTRHELVSIAWPVRLPPSSQKHRSGQQVGHALIVLADSSHSQAH